MTTKLTKKELNEKLNELAVKQKMLKQKQEKISKEIESVNNDIKELLGDNEVYSTNTFTFTFKHVVKTILDTKLFKKEHADLFQLYSKKSISRPLLIN